MAEHSLLEQVGGLLAAAKKSLEDGKLVADPSKVASRAAICMSCEKIRERRGKFSCVTCGCSFKLKIATHGASCPLKKW